MTDPDLTPEALDTLHRSLPGVSVPEHMHGDNLAILLCSFFDDAEGEGDENGWTDAAIAGQEAVLAAIRAHYDPTLRALRAQLTEADACNRGLVRLNEATQARAERAADTIAALRARLAEAEARAEELTLAAAEVVAWFDRYRSDLSGPRIRRLRYAVAAFEPAIAAEAKGGD
jgi:hypothetical protein